MTLDERAVSSPTNQLDAGQEGPIFSRTLLNKSPNIVQLVHNSSLRWKKQLVLTLLERMPQVDKQAQPQGSTDMSRTNSFPQSDNINKESLPKEKVWLGCGKDGCDSTSNVHPQLPHSLCSYPAPWSQFRVFENSFGDKDRDAALNRDDIQRSLYMFDRPQNDASETGHR